MITKGFHKKGFTLPEVMVTAAIVTSVAAVTIPNYLTYRMNANMEMVRQHMRQIGNEMMEIWTKNGTFPKPDSLWPLVGNPNTDPDEQAITASLSAIDSLCYTANASDFIVNTGKTTFEFCTSPKSDSCGKFAGNKKFCTHANPNNKNLASFAPFIVGELELWQGTFNFNSFYVSGIHTDPEIESNPDKLLHWLIEAAYFTEIYQFSYALPFFQNGTMTQWNSNFGLTIPINNLDQFKTSISVIIPDLEARGIEVSIGSIRGTVDSSGHVVFSGSATDESEGLQYANAQMVEIGFKFVDQSKRIISYNQFNQKLNELWAI